MTGDRHDEIAARLREEAAARAPERLRADVMLQVRAEPRPRRIRPRRSYRRPLGSLVAAACIVAAAAVSVTRLDAIGGGSGSGASIARQAALGASRGQAIEPGRAPLSSMPPHRDKAPSPNQSVLGAENGFGDAANSVPGPLRYAYVQRAALAAPLRAAFAPLELRQGRGTHSP
jgi:hypothetical protein